MEIIRIAGLHRIEKLNIAKQLPGPEAARGQRPHGGEHRVLARRPSWAIIHHYTKEAGVRNLEREIASVCRKVAVEVVKSDRKARVEVTAIEPGASTSGRRASATAWPKTEPQIGRRHRPGLDRAGRRAADRRGHGRARQGQADHHRQARRRDAGVRAGGDELRALARRGAWAWSRDFYQQRRHPHARPRGRHPQGRPVGGHHHGHRAGLGAVPRSRCATTWP